MATLVCIAAHTGHAVKYDSVTCLHGVEQLIQLSAALISCAGIYFSDDMCGWVRCQNVAYLPFDILLWSGNTAVTIYLHGGILPRSCHLCRITALCGTCWLLIDTLLSSRPYSLARHQVCAAGRGETVPAGQQVAERIAVQRICCIVWRAAAWRYVGCGNIIAI